MSTIIIGGQEFPTSCPPECLEVYHPFNPSCLCMICPVFCCAGSNPLMPPESYRDDWAKAFRAWFDRGMTGRPALPLFKEE